MDLRQIIIDKLIELIGAENKQEIEELQAEQALNHIFNFYQEELQFMQKQLEKLVDVNADFKVKEISLNYKYQQLDNIHRNRVAEGTNTISSAAKINQQEIQQERKRADDYELQLKNSFKENAEVKQQLRTLKQKILIMEEEYAQELEKAKTTLLADLDHRLRLSEQTVRKIKDTEIKTLQKERNNWREQLIDVIDTVNEMLEINAPGSSDISKWIKQFKTQISKFKKEVDSYAFESQRAKPKSYVMKLAQHQKEKIAARRMYLIKTVLEKPQ